MASEVSPSFLEEISTKQSVGVARRRHRLHHMLPYVSPINLEFLIIKISLI